MNLVTSKTLPSRISQQLVALECVATSAAVYDFAVVCGSVVFVSTGTGFPVVAFGASITVVCSVHTSFDVSVAGVTIGVMVFPQEERKIDAAIMRMTYFFIKKNLESNTWRIVI